VGVLKAFFFSRAAESRRRKYKASASRREYADSSQLRSPPGFRERSPRFAEYVLEASVFLGVLEASAFLGVLE